MPMRLEGSCRCGAISFTVDSHTPYPISDAIARSAARARVAADTRSTSWAEPTL